MVKLKQASNKLSIRKRFLALTSNERLVSRDLKLGFMSILNILRDPNVAQKNKFDSFSLLNSFL